MKIPFVDLKAQYQSIKTEIDTAIATVIDNTAFIGGKHVEEFEQKFADLYGVKHCISVANGTDSLYIIMKMLGIGSGDEVITVANTWISTSETITQTGAKVVFVDIDPDYYSVNEHLIEEKITESTKAIIVVHLQGQACDMSTISAIAQKNNLFIIEDCAQSHFSEFQKKRVGTFGNAASFSFFPGKNLGAYGDAGCIITNDDELATKCKMFARHGALKKHQHQIEGINSRLDGLQAAILIVKMNYILNWTEQRIQNAKIYDKLLKDIGDIVCPKVRKTTKHSYHLYVIRTKYRNELQMYLKEHGIETAVHYPTPLPFLPAYEYLSHSFEDFPVAYAYQNEILSLPMYPELTKEQINYITTTIKAFFKAKI